MTGGVVVISRRPAATGLLLAGIDVDEVDDATQAASRIEALLGRSDVAVILVEQELYDQLSEETLRAHRRVAPALVPIPGPEQAGEGEAEQYIVEMLRRAIGYRVQL